MMRCPSWARRRASATRSSLQIDLRDAPFGTEEEEGDKEDEDKDVEPEYDAGEDGEEADVATPWTDSR